MIRKRHGARLPHWTNDGATYAITFRLADSVPQEVLDAWEFERRDILVRAEQAGRSLTAVEEERLKELSSDEVERCLDAGHGSCAMKDDRVATIVVDALQHFDGQRYDLLPWCVMPNHVHVMIRPQGGHELSELLHSWKSFTAKKINKLLGRQGEFWQVEYYDHLIRDSQDFARQARYIQGNPATAGLLNWRWVGVGRDEDA